MQPSRFHSCYKSVSSVALEESARAVMTASQGGFVSVSHLLCILFFRWHQRNWLCSNQDVHEAQEYRVQTPTVLQVSGCTWPRARRSTSFALRLHVHCRHPFQQGTQKAVQQHWHSSSSLPPSLRTACIFSPSVH